MSVAPGGHSWLVDGFVRRTPGVTCAAVVSADGLLLTASSQLARDRADQLAAIAASLASLARGTARCFDGGGVIQTVIEMDGGFVMIMAISDGSVLAVVAQPQSDIGLIGYEMTVLTHRVGRTLTPERRTLAPVRAIR